MSSVFEGRSARRAQRKAPEADLTKAYKAQTVERGIAMLDRRAVLIQDEVTSTNPTEVWWFLHTAADDVTASRSQTRC